MVIEKVIICNSFDIRIIVDELYLDLPTSCCHCTSVWDVLIASDIIPLTILKTFLDNTILVCNAAWI